MNLFAPAHQYVVRGLVGASAVFALAGAASAQTPYAYVNVIGSTKTALAIVASDAGGVDVGMRKNPELLLASAAMSPTSRPLQRGTVDRMGLQRMLNDLDEQVVTAPDTGPAAAPLAARAAHGNKMAEAAKVYLRMQQMNPGLIIDVLSIPTAGVGGEERSKRLANAFANALRAAGVKNVRVDFNATTSPFAQAEPGAATKAM